MKCSIILHFICILTVCKGKKDLQTKKFNILLKIYNLTPQDTDIGLSEVYCIIPEEESISIQRDNPNFVHKKLSYRPMDKSGFKLDTVKKKVSMTKKCHNHTLQTNPQHHEEEAKNINSDMTFRRQ